MAVERQGEKHGKIFLGKVADEGKSLWRKLRSSEKKFSEMTMIMRSIGDTELVQILMSGAAKRYNLLVIS